MVKFHQLISKWIADHPVLKDHFVVKTVEPRDPVTQATSEHWPEGVKAVVVYKCKNYSRPYDALVEIYEDEVEVMHSRVPAHRPTLFERLERELRRVHDRTGEFNIVTFRHNCESWLRDCACKKNFCGC